MIIGIVDDVVEDVGVRRDERDVEREQLTHVGVLFGRQCHVSTCLFLARRAKLCICAQRIVVRFAKKFCGEQYYKISYQ